jgi:hypothetical protein
MNAMKPLYFDDYAEIGEYMYELADAGFSSAAVLFCDDAKELADWIELYEDVEVEKIDYEHCDSWEYYVILDTDMQMSLIPAFCDHGNVIPQDVDVMLFDGDATTAIARANDCEQFEIVMISGDESFCGDCCEDCSNCSHKSEIIDAIDSALGMIDLLIKHMNDE